MQRKKFFLEFSESILPLFSISRTLYGDKDPWRAALRENYEEQKKKLLELKDYMINTIFADNYCAEGCIITLNGILELHLYVKEHFDLPSLLTSHVDQDYVEGAFKDIRADSRHSDPKLIISFGNSAI